MLIYSVLTSTLSTAFTVQRAGASNTTACQWPFKWEYDIYHSYHGYKPYPSCLFSYLQGLRQRMGTSNVLGLDPK